ncbi:hypothetical protein [uncultured Legionella sp.]|uniref:hypothetical protein n=1 Tax=uncultured Legionella sp. TaxID=210934 RepID=UPI00262E30EC|nr:hypothetical protein [uncultured Legionella sp.]
MKAWINAVSVLLLLLIVNSANAISLSGVYITNFAQLVSALNNGEDVRAIIHLERCLIINSTDSTIQEQINSSISGVSTRFDFNKFLHYTSRIDGRTRDTVTTSMTTLVEQSTPGVFWKVFARLSVFGDESNTGNLRIDYFDPVSHKSQLVVEWRCDISNGNDNNGLVLIDDY